MDILLTEFADVSPLADEELFARATERVPEWRRAKVRRLRRPEARRLSLGAGLLLARAMKSAGVPLDAEIAFDPHGKPFYPVFPRFHFCLSHSGDFAMCSNAPSPVGCDIQKVDPSRLKNRRLVARTIGADSLPFFDGMDEERKVRAFFAAWGMRESAFKMLGSDADFDEIPPEMLFMFSDEGFFRLLPGYCVVVGGGTPLSGPPPQECVRTKFRGVELEKILRSPKR